MAKFKTHVGAAFAASVSAAAIAPLASVYESALVVTAGTIGGILPDIDQDSSKPTRLLFSILAVAASMAFFGFYYDKGLSQAVIMAVFGLLFVFFAVRSVFFTFTTHRGVFHSIPVAMLAGIGLYYAIAHYLSHDLALQSALFLTLGYTIHLALDEIFSVDFMGARLKSSFGSAVKLFEKDRMALYAGLYALNAYFLADIFG
jgi:membrane-bound metal-dependent hydrolase YbcI (DUF457 family)